MRNTLLTVGALALGGLASIAPASAHNASEVRHQLRDKGYYDIEFVVRTAPFSVNACRGGERYHLHVDYYGNLIDRSSIGRCGGDRYSRRDRSGRDW